MSQITVEMAKALDDVLEERIRQSEKWGTQRLSWPEWIAVLGEEFGEASKAAVDIHWQHNATTLDQLREELVHVAAVAVQIIEHIDEVNQ